MSTKKNSYVTVTDQFCGAGGSSLGATAAGAEVVLAMNHWKRAIETHNTNFPNTRHVCTDIHACDPKRYQSTDILITSPECFPAGTLILTARGFSPIEDVQIGDEVLTHRSRWMPVTGVMETHKDTVAITGQGHRSLEVSGKHPFYVRHQTQKWNNPKRDYDRQILDEPEWVEAENLSQATYRWATPVRVDPLPVPSIMGGNNRTVEFTPEFWWAVGRWLGDGSVRIREGASSEITICCGKKEVDELEQLHFAPRQGPHAKQTEIHWRKREIRTVYLFECSHDSLARWLVQHFGKRANGKSIPAWVLGMDVSWRNALLEGYVSADGSRNERYTSTASVSKSLSLGIRLLASGLGYYASLGRYRHAAGEIEGRPFDEYYLWLVRWENNKSERTGRRDHQHSWTLIKQIQPCRQNVLVYNLSVAEDESYVADGLVVHNCTNHSLAKGKKRKNQNQAGMFEEPLSQEAEERSRATMWDVVRFAEEHEYRIIIVENVVDARMWGLWKSWLETMTIGLKYECEIVYFNSMYLDFAQN